MSHVAIEKIDEKRMESASVFEEINALTQQVRERAFEIFEGRNSADGSALEDWLNAERDLFVTSESDLTERDGKFEVRLTAPGFEAGDFKVTALPDALIVKAASTHTHKEKDGNARVCELGGKSLYRRFDLPEPINLDKVTADLNKGVLHLTAAIEAKADGKAGPKAAAA